MLDRKLLEDLFEVIDAEAEDESIFQASFVEDDKFAHFSSDSAFRIVIGNKGTGKSAFLRRYVTQKASDHSNVVVRLDPGIIFEQAGEFPAKAHQQSSYWREFFTRQAAINLLSSNLADITRLHNEAIQSATNEIMGWIQSIAKKLTLGASDLVLKHGRKLDDIKTIIFVIDNLDKDWDGRIEGVNFVSSLLSAAFDLTRIDRSVKFRISLRWDIFDAVGRINGNFDKMRPNFTHLTWTQHQVYIIVAKRIASYTAQQFDANYAIKASIHQKDIEVFYDSVIERRFYGQGIWQDTNMRKVLLSMSRRRPRDLLSLLHKSGILSISNRHDRILTADVQETFPSISEERISDICVEYKSRFSHLEALLYKFRPTGSAKRFSDVYRFTNDQILKKIKAILSENHAFKFENKMIETSPQSVVEFLYRIEFLQAIYYDGSRIKRVDFDQNKKVFTGKEDLGYSWEVLPVYRWAFQATDQSAVYQTIKDSNSDDAE